MAKSLPPAGQFDFSRGVINTINTFIAPPNSVRHAINFVFDEEYGSAKVRRGSTIVGAQLTSNNNVLGMHNHRDRDGGAHALLAGVNGTIYNVATGSALRGGMSANATMQFETYLDETVVQNGTDAPLAFTGTGSFGVSTTLDTANMPIGVDVLNFKDRLWVLQASGILRGSSIPQSPSYNTISWTSGNKTIPIDPDASSYTGSGIGLARAGGLLLIFKERAMYTYNGSATQADFLYDVGCSSVRSIGSGGGYVFFFNSDGIWRTVGERPQRISRPVQAYIDGMSSANLSSVAGHANGQYYWCSIGDVTIGLTTYTNVVLRYSIATEEWAVLSYANRPTAFSQYINGTAVTVAYGETTARVLTIDSGTTDNETAIECELLSHPFIFGSRGLMKDVHDKFLAYTQNSSDLEIQFRVNRGDFVTVGHAMKQIEEVPIMAGTFGNILEVRFIGSSIGTQTIIDGFEMPRVSTTGYGSTQ